MSFFGRLISLCIISLWFIHVIVNDRISLFYKTGKYSIVYTYGLNTSPQNTYIEILTSKGDGISNWSLWEVLKS